MHTSICLDPAKFEEIKFSIVLT